MRIIISAINFTINQILSQQLLAVDFLKFKIKESKMTILLIFSTILLKTINFLVICYLLAKISMLESFTTFSGGAGENDKNRLEKQFKKKLEKLKLEKKLKKEGKNEKNVD